MTNASSDDSFVTKGLNLVGKEFANYRILAELGRGGMAIVYKADELSLNRVVALKVMSPKISEDDTMVKRFAREAQSAAKLSHPNIIHIYAIGEQDGIHFFTMEYVKGKTLKEMRKETGRLSVAEAVPLMIQAAEALGEAHKAGLVHRDIKPSNIMVDSAGRVKVADFGIARVAEATTQLTVDGSFLGTPQYMSPEQCEGKDVDGRSDIYSLGVTFYEMLTGRIPYDAETPASILVKILKGEFKPIREIVPSVPETIQSVIGKMLHLDREQRYQNADELVRALKQIETGPAEATAVTMAVPTLATSAAAVPSPVQSTPPVTDAKPPALQAQAAGKPRSKMLLGIAAVVALALIAALAVYVLVGERFSRSPKVAPIGELPEPASPAATEPQEAVSTRSPDSQESRPRAAAQAKQELAGQVEKAASGAQLPNVQPRSVGLPETRTAETGTTEPGAAKEAGVATSAGSVVARESGSSPDSDTVVVTITGDDDNKGDLAASEAELALTEKGLVVIDRGVAEGKKLADIAAMNMVMSFTQTGTTDLQYLGRTTVQYTVAITMKIVDCGSGKTKAGPVSATVQYTALTAQQVLGQTARRLAEELQGQLK